MVTLDFTSRSPHAKSQGHVMSSVVPRSMGTGMGTCARALCHPVQGVQDGRRSNSRECGVTGDELVCLWAIMHYLNIRLARQDKILLICLFVPEYKKRKVGQDVVLQQYLVFPK